MFEYKTKLVDWTDLVPTTDKHIAFLQKINDEKHELMIDNIAAVLKHKVNIQDLYKDNLIKELDDYIETHILDDIKIKHNKISNGALEDIAYQTVAWALDHSDEPFTYHIDMPLTYKVWSLKDFTYQIRGDLVWNIPMPDKKLKISNRRKDTMVYVRKKRYSSDFEVCIVKREVRHKLNFEKIYK